MTATVPNESDRLKRKRSQFDDLVRRWEGRWRTRHTLLNLPRALMGILFVGLLLAIGLRAAPGMSGWQAAAIVGAACAALTVIALAVLLRGRPPLEAARQFDTLFGLQERISTALELLEGRIHTAPDLAAHQIDDAYAQAQAVDARSAIQLETRWWQWFTVLLMAAGLALVLVLNTTAAGASGTGAAARQAVEDAAADVRDITEDVANETRLNREERENLLESLETRLDELQDEDTSTERAFASMSELERELRETAEDIRRSSAAQQQAEQQAASSLSEQAGGADEQAASSLEAALQQAQQNLQTLDGTGLEQLAQALRQAAGQLGEQPQLSEALNQAAQNMDQDDLQAAQEALQEALERLEQAQQQRQEREEAAEQLEQSAEQARESAREIAESERGDQTSEQQQGEERSQTQSQQQELSPEEQSGEASSSEDAQSSEEAQGGSESDQSAGEGEPQSGGEEAASEEASAQGQVEGETAPNEASQASSVQQPGDGSNAGDAGRSDQPATSADQSAAVPQNNPDGAGETAFEPIYAPERLGAEASDNVILEPDGSDSPVIEGDFQENPTGESRVPYNEVFRDYADAANRALDNDYIPLGLRDVIRDYFSLLEPGR